MKVSHIVVKKEVYSGREEYILGQEGRIYMFKRRVHSGREGGGDSESVTLYKRGYILGGRGIFWEDGIYRSLKVGILWEEGVDSGIRRHLT